jgi:ribosomal protein S18 acetylase RimI-like enzyme
MGGFERRCTELGFSSAQLSVLDSNERARRFYEKAGWVAEDQKDGSSVLYRKTFRARESSATS